MKSLRNSVVLFLLFFVHLPTFSQSFNLLKDINTGVSGSCLGYPREPLNLTEANGLLYFTVWGGAGTSPGLWKSDGTPAGTVRVKEVSSIDKMVNVNGTLFFSIEPNQELWKSDGTEAGTVVVANLVARNLTNVNGTLYFTTPDGLWKSDGTASGTVMIAGLSSAEQMSYINGTLYFLASNTLWKSDGTSAGTVPVTDNFYPFSRAISFIGANGNLYIAVTYFSIGQFEIWQSDGTDAGTTLIKRIDNGSTFSSTRNLTALNGIIYFFANSPTNGTSLYRTDGTDPGTFEVKELGAGSFPMELVVYNDKLFFAASDPVHGTELWTSDGTAAGTTLFKEINENVDASGPLESSPGNFLNINGTLFFSAINEARPEGSYGCGDARAELFKTDGTAAGTVLVKNIYDGAAGSSPSSLTNVGGNLFFVATDGLAGRELWTSNGSANGTSLVKNIFTTGGSNPRDFVLVNGIPYFVARDPRGGPSFLFGNELYITDGTISNTLQLRKFVTLGESFPQNPTAFKNQLFFSASSDFGSSKLWKNDGTHRGTTMVKDVTVAVPDNTPPVIVQIFVLSTR